MSPLHGRLILDPEGDNRDQGVEVLIGSHGEGVDPVDARKLPEPEEPLLLGGAQEIIGPHQLLVQDVGHGEDGLATTDGSKVLGLLQLLQVHRIVDIGDDDLIRVDEPWRPLEEEALEHNDIRPVSMSAQMIALGVVDLEARVLHILHAGRREQPHRMGLGEGRRHLPCADGGAGKLAGQRLPRDNQDVGGGDEEPVNPEGVDQDLVTLEVVLDGVGGLDGVAEEREQILVAHGTSPLELCTVPPLVVGCFAEVVYGVAAGTPHLRPGALGVVLRRRRLDA